MARFKSSISVQVTVTLSIVLLVFSIAFALFMTRYVRQFGDAFTDRTIGALRQRMAVNLADRVSIRALHYDHIFESVARSAAQIAEKAEYLLFEAPLSSLHCETVPSLKALTPSGALMGPADATVMMMQLPDVETPSPPGTQARLACLAPYLEILGHGTPIIYSAYFLSIDGFAQYYPNTMPPSIFSGLTMGYLKERTWFTGASPQENPAHTPVWTSLYPDVLHAEVVVTASAPVISPAGALKGVVGMDMHLKSLFDEIYHEQGILMDEDGLFWFLVDDTGVPIVMSPEYRVLLGLQGPQGESTPRGFLEASNPEVRHYARTLLSLDKGGERLEMEGNDWLLFHQALPSTGWVLGAGVRDDALFSGLKKMRLKYGQATRRMGWEIVVGAILFTALALGLFYSVLKERVVRPLRMLSSQAKRVSQGNLDIETISLSGADEMACLARSFEQMIASLKQGRDVEERATDYLECLVRSRTREAEEKAEALHGALAELTTIFSNSMVGIMLLKGERCLWKANYRLARILGYDSSEEMEGVSMRKFHLSMEGYMRYGSLCHDALAHGEPVHMDYPLMRRDGSTVWCSLSGKAVDSHMPPDLNKGVLWMVDDITERRAAEQAIRESEVRFREMAELLPCMVCEVDLDFRVVYINSLGLASLGLSSEDYKKRGTIFKALHIDDRHRFVDHMGIVLKGGDVGATEYRMIHRDGHEMMVILHSAPMMRKGTVVGLRASLTDVTEYRHLQEALVAQQKLDLIGSLTGGVAHDFNNMLAILLGRVELAVLSLDTGHPVHVHLDSMEETIARARELMGRLITLSAQGEGVAPAMPLQDVLGRCVAQAGGEAAGIFLEILEAIPPVPVDGPQMIQAIASVVKNAREAYDGPKGLVWVRCAWAGREGKGSTPSSAHRWVEVTVRDEGRGISEAHQPYIFDPYYTTQKRGAQKGKGFGLAITHAVVTRHGGTLTVSSRSNQGTTVYIVLPLGPGESEA